MSEKSYTVAALAKGLRVLTLFSESNRQLRLSEIADRANMPTPTAFRLLRTLESEGYVEQDAEGRFRPGPAVLSLGFAALRASSLIDAAALPLQELAECTGETVNLGVLVRDHVLYLHRIRNQDLVTADLQVGSALPAVCSSMGKVLLAALPPDDLEQTLSHADLGKCGGPRAPLSIEEVRSDLEGVRDQGWALQDQQVAHGIRSVAAPVRGPVGSTVAAINLTVQTTRWSCEELVTRFLPRTLETAAQISLRLGYRGM